MAKGKKKQSIAKTKTEQIKVQGESVRSHTRATETAIPYERAIFRGSSRVDAHNVRAVFYQQDRDREVETIEPVERIRDLKPGTECGLLIDDELGRDSLKARRPSLVLQNLEWVYTPTFLMDMTRIRDDAYEIQQVVFKRKLETKEYGTLAVFTQSSGVDIAVAMPPQTLGRLDAGDVCEVFFAKDSGSVAEGGGARLYLSVGGFPVDFDASFLNLLRKAGSVEGGDVHSSLQQLPTPTLEEIPTEQFRREREPVPTADEILDDIAAVQGPIIHKLNAWLASFEGKTFSPDEAKSVVSEIRHVVARAGCELVLKKQVVSLTCSASARSKNATIRVFSAGGGRSERIHSESAFPLFTARPATGPNSL